MAQISSNKFTIRIMPAGPTPNPSLPSWVPAPGQLKSIHANDISSVNPCVSDACWYSEASKQNGPWANWCGAVFAFDYSQYGAMIFWGGGHGGYDGTEFYIFDLTTQKWSRLNDPVPHNFLPDTSAEWCDVLEDGNYIAPASHTYSGPVYWPPSAGGGTKGSWVLPYNVYGGGPGEGAGTSGYRPHAVDLATGQWTRLTSNTVQNYYAAAANGACFVDKNNILWGLMGSSSSAHIKIDLNAPVKTVNNYNGHLYTPGYYWNPAYVPERDFLVVAYCNYTGNVPILAVYDLTVNSGEMSSTPPVIGAPTMRSSGFGFDYCPDTNKFYAYNGYGDQLVHVLTPPATASWKTGTWTWSTETMGGELATSLLEVQPAAQGAQPFTKWKYNPKLKSFMWSQGTASRPSPDGIMRKGAFQLYRPLGT